MIYKITNKNSIELHIFIANTFRLTELTSSLQFGSLTCNCNPTHIGIYIENEHNAIKNKTKVSIIYKSLIIHYILKDILFVFYFY